MKPSVLLAKAKRLVKTNYGFSVTEVPDLGLSLGIYTTKGLAIAPDRIEIRADCDITMKVIAICHEAGHLFDLKKDARAWLDGSELKREMRAWINGLPMAMELGITQEYLDYWKIHLGKI